MLFLWCSYITLKTLQHFNCLRFLFFNQSLNWEFRFFGSLVHLLSTFIPFGFRALFYILWDLSTNWQKFLFKFWFLKCNTFTTGYAYIVRYSLNMFVCAEKCERYVESLSVIKLDKAWRQGPGSRSFYRDPGVGVKSHHSETQIKTEIMPESSSASCFDPVRQEFNAYSHFSYRVCLCVLFQT